MNNRTSYTIKSGDTLSEIAQRYLGTANRWQEITKDTGECFTENEARRLQIGQVVYLPSENHIKASNNHNQKISDNGLKFIADHEGMILHLYNDPANHATIGVGHLVHHGPIDGSESEEFKRGITKERAMEILRDDVKQAEKTVKKLVKVPLNQNQFDALVSFVFNIGETQFASSTLLAKLNNQDYNSVPSELNRWVHGSGKKLPGLINRRRDEGNLFQSKN
ncbi:phage-related lysozyme (muraminidase) [Rivularia sp. PCC 7116]|uniref:glycoside hydrolase family protein n=1 Tax=Rivularia sp. PCC 7116 TaxID=373994 RepID=UPI00029EDD77|nr:glycoside hydrolase family protein [Rivularia sp. PCC 7116]AFY53470.1 phage-related lysozyme (muraminidase) [Rivularia sp. PCC 7116]